MDKNSRPEAIRSVLTVKHTQYLSPHYIRVTLTGEEVQLFKEATVGANNKIFLPVEGEKEIHFGGPKSIRRTYTHRGIDLGKNEMTIDFVSHGETGPASAWAMHAKAGDPLGVAMKARASSLYPEADWYLLVGDATGIPVLAAILESLPASAQGVAFIEVRSKEEEIPLTTAANIEINWVYNTSPGESELLATAVRNVDFPTNDHMTYFGYVAAEYSTVKDVRTFLRKEKNWDKEALYAYSYWKYGKSEDGSVAERQEEKHALS